ncbi:hypothetical protein Tco_0307038 [Tanacetum coccineum]
MLVPSSQKATPSSAPSSNLMSPPADLVKPSPSPGSGLIIISFIAESFCFVKQKAQMFCALFEAKAHEDLGNIMDGIDIEDLSLSSILNLHKTMHPVTKQSGTREMLEIQQKMDNSHSDLRRQARDDALRNWEAQINQLRRQEHEVRGLSLDIKGDRVKNKMNKQGCDFTTSVSEHLNERPTAQETQTYIYDTDLNASCSQDNQSQDELSEKIKHYWKSTNDDDRMDLEWEGLSCANWVKARVLMEVVGRLLGDDKELGWLLGDDKELGWLLGGDK